MKKKTAEPAPTLSDAYALRILNALPPKQAGLYSAQVSESCRLLEQEARLATKEETYKNLEALIKGSLNEVDLIFALADYHFNDHCRPGLYHVVPRERFDAFPISDKAKMLLEIAYQYVDKLRENERSTS